MKRIGWLVSVLLFVLAVPELPAQLVVVPAPGLSVGYLKVRKRSAYGFSYNPGYTLYNTGAFAGPYGPVYAPGFAPAGFTQIVIQGPPIIIPPPAPPIIIQQAPIEAPPPMPRLRARQEDEDLPPVPPPPMVDEPLPGREAGGFRPLDPDNREKAHRPVPLVPEKKVQPKIDVIQPPPDLLLPRPPVNPDPRVESLRQIELGKTAFAHQEYGRAAERFRQAAELAPASALPQFLLAQAQIALGNHRRAFEALQIGLRHQPDWPAQAFRPIELYDDNMADYAEDLRILDTLLAAFPDDPVLQFLSAYQLWSDGRRDEARPLFEKAAPALPDPSIVDRFLQALPSSEVI